MGIVPVGFAGGALVAQGRGGGPGGKEWRNQTNMQKKGFFRHVSAGPRRAPGAAGGSRGATDGINRRAAISGRSNRTGALDHRGANGLLAVLRFALRIPVGSRGGTRAPRRPGPRSGRESLPLPARGPKGRALQAHEPVPQPLPHAEYVGSQFPSYSHKAHHGQRSIPVRLGCGLARPREGSRV